MEIDKVLNGGDRLPHKYRQTLIEELHSDPSTQWITDSLINSHLKRLAKIPQSEAAPSSEINREDVAVQPPPPPATVTPRSKGGRPMGTTETNPNALLTTDQIAKILNSPAAVVCDSAAVSTVETTTVLPANTCGEACDGTMDMVMGMI
jgi:hypothetical protein